MLHPLNTIKRFFALLLALTLMLSLAACMGFGNNTQPTEGEETIPTEPANEYPRAEVPETLKVLAIGNSFSVDAMEYLYDIAASAGVKNIVLGNLRHSGCTVSMHYNYATTDAPEYTYLKNTTGTWVSTDGATFSQGLLDEDWDFITMQQASHDSGNPDEYGDLEALITIVNAKKTNPDAKLYWHMTWAYQQDSTHSGFAYYRYHQVKMYNAIVDTVKEVVLPTGHFDGVIPSGTAVQNARTSFMGDSLTRDGYHMVRPFGRYLVGLAFFAALTGADVSDITYVPATSVTANMSAMAKEAVTNAMRYMYTVTESTYKTK